MELDKEAFNDILSENIKLRDQLKLAMNTLHGIRFITVFIGIVSIIIMIRVLGWL